jgi:hypothetical protein
LGVLFGWLSIIYWGLFGDRLFVVPSGQMIFELRRCCRLTSRRSQPPLALAFPLSRFSSQASGGSAF